MCQLLFDNDVQLLRSWEHVLPAAVGCTYGYSYSSPSGLRNIGLMIYLGKCTKPIAVEYNLSLFHAFILRGPLFLKKDDFLSTK